MRIPLGTGTSARTISRPTPDPTYILTPSEAGSDKIIPLVIPVMLGSDPKVFGYRESKLASFMASKGYTTARIGVQSPVSREFQSEDLDVLSKDFANGLEISGHTYKPCVCAQGTIPTLVAQKYVESNPASALVLISPPPESSSTFEPTFPILIVDTPKQMKIHKKVNRLLKHGEADVDCLEFEDKGKWDNPVVLERIAKWMEEDAGLY